MPKVIFNLDNPSGPGQITLHVTRDLAITEDTLQDCFETHAGMLSWYAALHRNVELKADTAEDEFDNWCVQRKSAIRALAEGKVTEKALDEGVQCLPEYVVRQAQVRKLRFEANTLKDFVTAWLERGRMLMKLGVQAREKWETEFNEPSVRKKKKRLDD